MQRTTPPAPQNLLTSFNSFSNLSSKSFAKKSAKARFGRLAQGLLIALSTSLVLLPGMGKAIALEPGSISEIEGDVSCGMHHTGGAVAYAETASSLIYICSDATHYTEPHYLLVLNRATHQQILLSADHPQQMRYFEFKDPTTQNTYILQMPQSAIPNPVFAVELPNGLRFEEPVTRYLSGSPAQANNSGNANSGNTNSGNAVTVWRLGDRGTAITNLQRDLKKLGFDPGPIDGVFGAKTEIALKAFQNQAGLPATGVYDHATSVAFFDRFD
jgi:hypothetical protein